MPDKPILADYLLRHDLARELNTTVRSLQRWERAGTGPAPTHIGKNTYYSPSAVQAWLAAQQKHR
jgi:hypothetical protein